jgi:hypothetical protein
MRSSFTFLRRCCSCAAVGKGAAARLGLGQSAMSFLKNLLRASSLKSLVMVVIFNLCFPRRKSSRQWSSSRYAPQGTKQVRVWPSVCAQRGREQCRAKAADTEHKTRRRRAELNSAMKNRRMTCTMETTSTSLQYGTDRFVLIPAHPNREHEGPRRAASLRFFSPEFYATFVIGEQRTNEARAVAAVCLRFMAFSTSCRERSFIKRQAP